MREHGGQVFSTDAADLLEAFMAVNSLAALSHDPRGLAGVWVAVRLDFPEGALGSTDDEPRMSAIHARARDDLLELGLHIEPHLLAWLLRHGSGSE